MVLSSLYIIPTPFFIQHSSLSLTLPSLGLISIIHLYISISIWIYWTDINIYYLGRSNEPPSYLSHYVYMMGKTISQAVLRGKQSKRVGFIWRVLVNLNFIPSGDSGVWRKSYRFSIKREVNARNLNILLNKKFQIFPCKSHSPCPLSTKLW